MRGTVEKEIGQENEGQTGQIKQRKSNQSEIDYNKGG